MVGGFGRKNGGVKWGKGRGGGQRREEGREEGVLESLVNLRHDCMSLE